MFGAGFTQSALVSLKNNKQDRKTTFDKDVKAYEDIYGKLVDHKKMSAKEFKLFQEKLRLEERKAQQKLLMIFGGVIFLILFVVIYFLFLY